MSTDGVKEKNRSKSHQRDVTRILEGVLSLADDTDVWVARLLFSFSHRMGMGSRKLPSHPLNTLVHIRNSEMFSRMVLTMDSALDENPEFSCATVSKLLNFSEALGLICKVRIIIPI